MTVNDLAGIGSHNKREKQSYKSNPDIKKELSYNNIELVHLTEKEVFITRQATKSENNGTL